jgi:hypothetical protein
MKKIPSLLLMLVFSVLSTNSFSHGGGLNAQGCHNETATGGYHCHRASYTPPSPTRTSSPQSNPSPIIASSPAKKVDGSFVTKVNNIVFKNVRCVDNKWRLSFVNRGTSRVPFVKILFYTVDSDGDPLQTDQQYIEINGKARKEVTLSAFNCKSTPFEDLNRSIS